MAKAHDGIKELQRRLRQLARLDGKVVRTADGPVLLRPVSIDPFALLTACRAGRPSLSAVLAAVRCDGEPQRLTPTLLARAQRDLRALAALPWLAIVQSAPRHFRSFGPLDERWLAAREARLTALGHALQHSPDPADPIHDLVADLHGQDAADLLADWSTRSAGLGARRRREATRRLDGLVRRVLEPGAIHREPAALAIMLDAAALELLRLTQIPGRAAARRLEPILRRVLAWPRAATGHAAPVPEDIPSLTDPEPPDHPRPVPRDIPQAARLALAARVRDLGAELVHALGTTRAATHLTALRRVLGLYSLAFAVDPTEPPPPALAPDELELAESQLRATIPTPAVSRLTLARALWLLRLPVPASACTVLAPWVADGLAPALVEQVVALKLHERLAGLTGDVELATAYADWLVRVLPHYRRLGVEVELGPDHFARLHATHRGGVALLAHCLIEHHAPGEQGADAQLARLRATLGLFTARPRRAEALLAELTHAPPGAGRQHFPDFAAWLGDDPLLDRYAHLCTLAAEPITLSTTLRRDFDRHDRIVRQRDHLASLPTPTPALQARLARLESELAHAQPADRGWTLRRLAERCDILQARAFASRLDEILRDLLRDAIGVAPPSLTPAWRDALRFYLGAADRNRALLRELLRFAAAEPGRPIAPTLPRNQAWLTRAAAHMRTDAWLAPQVRTLELVGVRHTLRIEDDPLEVLRMGIPFGTCLALETGFNADSTVLNAVDINKRVLYLRDPRGSVIARQLIAVSSDFGLLGYRIYCARGQERGEINAAFRALCHDLATTTGLPLADHGLPETIHPGFWYDDGAEYWSQQTGVLADLEPWFLARGRPVPERLDHWTINRLRGWQIAERRDVEAGLALLPRLHNSAAAAAVQTMIADQIGPRELARRARRDRIFTRIYIAMQLHDGAIPALRAAISIPHDSQVWGDLAVVFEHCLPSAELARAWLAAALYERRHDRDFDDHGLAHRTTGMGESLACLPIAELLTRCSDLAMLWDWMVAEAPHCSHCREYGMFDLRRAVITSYAREPDPDAVVEALRGRHGPLAQDVALHVAARFSLSSRPCPLRPGLGASWVTRLTQRPSPAPQALRVLRGLLHSRPALADDPDMFAALVRQAGPDATHRDLPRPSAPPLAALGELLLHLPDLAMLLAPWQDPGVPPTKWQPDPWDLHFHRAALTTWRRQLARPGAHGHDCGVFLALLGDLKALERVDSPSYLALAREVRRQHSLRERPADAPCDASLLTSALAAREHLRPRDARTIDLALLREAARALTPPHDLSALVPALELLRAAELGAHEWHDIADQLLPPAGPPAPDIIPLLAEMLEQDDLKTLPGPLLVRLVAIPELHAPLLDRLKSGLDTHRVNVHNLYSQIERAPGLDPALRDAFLSRWIARSGSESADIFTSFGLDDEARFIACLPTWMQATPPTWLAIYRELRDLDLQSRFLDALLALPPERAPDLLELHKLATADWNAHNDDERTAHRWLLAALTPPAIST